VCVTAPICPASTPDLVTAWMAVAKSGVIPRKATLEAPMLPANYGKRRRRTSRTRPAAPSSGSRHCRAAPASRRQSTDPSSVCWSSVRSRHRRPEGSCLASGDAAAMQIVPAPCLPVAGCTRPSTKFPCGAEHSSARSATQRSRSWHCSHADAGALTIAFGERALECLRGSSKRRHIFPSRKARVDRWPCYARSDRAVAVAALMEQRQRLCGGVCRDAGGWNRGSISGSSPTAGSKPGHRLLLR